MHWTITTRMTAAIAATMVLSACAHKSPTKSQFGDSVRHMTGQQIYDLDAAYNPDPNAVQGGDVDRLNNVLDGHRNDIANPAEAVAAPVTGLSGGNR